MKIEGVFIARSLIEFYWEKNDYKEDEMWMHAYEHEKRVEKIESTKKSNKKSIINEFVHAKHLKKATGHAQNVIIGNAACVWIH